MSQPSQPRPAVARAIAVGTTLPERSIIISQALIDEYAALSGDFNPLHVDPAAGAKAGFGGSIAHGCIPMEPLCQSLQAFLSVDALPADTVVRLRYRAPSRPGDIIRSRAVVTGLQTAGSRELATIAFSCLNQRDETVLDGEVELTA